MQTIRVALSAAVATAVAVPLTLAAPFTTGIAGATVASPTLVYAADIDRDGLAGLYRATVADPTNKTAVLADNDAISVEEALLSPDGSRIAVLYDSTAANPSDTGARKLVTMNLDGSNQHVLATESVIFSSTEATFDDVNGFGWKGNDTIVYGWSTTKFSSGSNPVFTDQVRTVPAIGGTSAMVAGTSGYADPAVSPDGTQLVAVNYGDHTGTTDLEVFPSTGISATPPVLATSTTELRSPAWSTDGTAIVFVRDDSTDTLDASELDVTRFDSGTSTWGTATAAVPVVQGADSSWLDEDPYWTDANTLMFERIDDSSTASGDGVAPIDLWTAAFDTGTSTWGTAAKVADTPTVDEGSPSTAPADLTPPSAISFGGFGLGGTSVTLHWTASDADYSHVTLHRTDDTAGSPAVDIPNVFGTSYVDKNLVVGHNYTYTADTFDGAGNQAISEASHQVTATYAPKIVAPSPSSSVTPYAAFRVTWGVAGQPAGTTYDVDYAVKGGATWTLGTATHLVRGSTATNGVITGTPGQTYYIRAASHDTFGNTTITPWTSVNVPYDQKNGLFSSGWVTASNRVFWLGSIAYTGTNGTIFIISPTSKSVSIVGTKCPSCGKFAVYVDGHYRGTFSSAASTTKLRQILWTGVNTTISRHQIKLVAVLTRGQRLNIDGVADPR